MVKVRADLHRLSPACPDVMATLTDDGSTPSRRSTARSQRSSRAGSLLRDRLWRPSWWSRRTRPRWCRCRRSPARSSPVLYSLDAAAQGLCRHVSASLLLPSDASYAGMLTRCPLDLSPSCIFGIRPSSRSLCPPQQHPRTRNCSALGTAGFIISADKASREYELRKYAIGSGTELERISHENQRLERQAGIAGGQSHTDKPVTTREAVIEWAKENRWTAVGLT